MTDEELQQAHARMKELQAAMQEAMQKPELRKPELVTEWMSVTNALFAEARARGVINAEAHAPDGGEVGFDLDGAISHLLHGRP